MWLEAGLRWKDFLPEDEDVNKFVTEQVLKAKHTKIKVIIMVVRDGRKKRFIAILSSMILDRFSIL